MRYPAATWRPIPINYSTNGIRKPTLGLVLHVQAGNGELSGWFSNPKAQASSHFWISKAGAVFQYVDTDDRAWAQAGGNPDYLSVETEGYPTEPLTSAQVASLAALYRWGMQTFGWPATLAERPGDRGLGWHGMGGSAWGNHPGCPGNLRKAQRSAVLALATGTKEDLDVDVVNPLTQEKWPVEKALWSIWTYSIQAYTQSTAAVAAVKALADAQGIDGAAVQATVEKAVTEALADLKITLSTGG